MKLFYSPTSPFVRKVMVVAHEVGLAEQLERLPGAAHPVNRDRNIVGHNPLGQVPTLLLDSGQALADSRVICEFVDDLGGGSIFPRGGEARWRALSDQAIGDGILDAAILVRYEGAVRPEPQRSPDWIAGQMDKIRASLGVVEASAQKFGERVDIGTITFGCALGYLDLRFPDLRWREGHPVTRDWFGRFDERPAMKATRLVDPAASR